jgi:amidohydrolase
MRPPLAVPALIFLLGILVGSHPVCGASIEIPDARLEMAARAADARVIAWRRDIHQNPELSNREFRTAALVAEHLTKLGLEVKTKIAHTGVAGVLRGGRPGPVIALRADMDALPIKELTDVPFKSTATGQYGERTVPVMHACGHDVHTAVLMGVAEVLAGLRAELPGTVLFIFQPAEEGAPEGERGGAALMLEEGLFSIVKPDAVFGLHADAALHAGTIGYRAGPLQASADTFSLIVRGQQTHGARPWAGIDPITVSAQILLGFQTIVSRQIDITQAPAVISVGSFQGGLRQNIIPEQVEMLGTIRAFSQPVRNDLKERMERTATAIASASGATAQLTFREPTYPVLVNDPALVERVLVSLERVVGRDQLRPVALITASEDFACYASKVPGCFIRLGVTPPGVDAAQAPTMHSPHFYVDEAALGVGVRATLQIAVDYLSGRSAAAR